MTLARLVELPLQETLQDRFELEHGRVLLSGVQAVARLGFDQLRLDRAAGLDTRAFVSGYQGSPLGTLDTELKRQKELSAELGLVHQPGLNEELAATSVWGTQLVPGMRGATADGIVGIWYGKTPGVDRASDALRHGNFVGAHPRGGLLAVCGDDPMCKSSSIPGGSEATVAALGMPLLAPGSPQEISHFGLHAIALSRASGLWAALKVTTRVADGVGTVDMAVDEFASIAPEIVDRGAVYRHAPHARLISMSSVELERTMRGVRLDIARAYARLNRLNRIVLDPPAARLGFVASGAAYYDLREALAKLGLGEEQLRDLGIRILKLGLAWPLEPCIVVDFARGLDEIVVVEDKGPFVEHAVRTVLYGSTERPTVIGTTDERGEELLPPSGQVDADVITRALGPRLAARFPGAGIEERLARALGPAIQGPAPDVLARTPFFCSGCPHNRSTEASDDELVGGGIGCHSMVLLAPEHRGQLTGLTQMGGEGAQWIGQAPFVDDGHLTQNIGDGTFFHSGSLAVRAAVAAGVDMTYKVLYNGAVAMTGGQDVGGAMSVPDLTRAMEAEGVRRIVVTTDDPKRYRGVKLAAIAQVRDRRDLLEVQRELAAQPGVTMLIHDQECAAELRRKRKRGLAPARADRAVINERVCEGCGDCGRRSHCLSLLPVETEFGAKTRIQQGSCNQDFSCYEGDCPSFLSVIPGNDVARRRLPKPPADLPLPVTQRGEARLRLVGIGGTGVVTAAQVLAMAALQDGKRTIGADQTGLAQKGGPVVSDVTIVSAGTLDRAPNATTASVDAYLVFDILGAVASKTIEACDPGRTVAVISTSQSPPAAMVGNPDVTFPAIDGLVARIAQRTAADRNMRLDAHALAEALCGDDLMANSLLMGAAWQAGLIPIALPAMDKAFRLNGVAVERNLEAFAWGRAVVARPEAVAQAGVSEAELPPRLEGGLAEIASLVGAPPGSELQRLTAIRVAELAAYQSRRYARRYAEAIADVARREQAATGGSEVAQAVARNLYKLMAYKDEYEVARLHLLPSERARVERELGEGARVRVMLHPPILRALGLRRKIRLGRGAGPLFRALRAMRRLRGTPLDVFGYAEVRRVERRLIPRYEELVGRALDALPARPDVALALCELPDMVRGYEHVKLHNVERFEARAAELLASLSTVHAAKEEGQP